MAFLTDYLLPGVYAYGTCAGFCLLFNIRGKKLFSAPMGGVVAWEVYLLTGWTGNEILQFFLAAMALAAYSEVLARVQKAPVTVYLLTALLPLVPGGGIYYTMERCLKGDTQGFLETGLHTLGLAGALALGVLLVSSSVRLVHFIRHPGDRT